MLAMFWTWFGVTLSLAVVGFIVMTSNMHSIKHYWTDRWETRQRARCKKYARVGMWASLLSPLWPALILVLPVLGIKWVVLKYRDAFQMELSE